MDLKLFLNKFAKVDNIECYTMSALKELQNSYDAILKNTKGIDPDFPGIDFGDSSNTINLNTSGEQLDDSTTSKTKSGISDILDL